MYHYNGAETGEAVDGGEDSDLSFILWYAGACLC